MRGRDQRRRRASPTSSPARDGEGRTPARQPRTRRRGGGTITARDPERVRDRARVQWSGATERDQGELRGSTPCSTVTTRTVRSIAASTTATTPAAVTPARSRARRAATASIRPSAAKGRRRESGPTRRLRPSRWRVDRPVRSTPGRGALPRLRTHHEGAPGVEPGDRAASGADRVHRNRGRRIG